MFTRNNLFYPAIAEEPSLSPVPLEPSALKNSVIVRVPNWLGDDVMTFPALEQLKKFLPDGVCLVVLVPAGLVPLFRCLPFVDHIIPVQDAHAFLSAEEKRSIRRWNPCAGFLFNNSFRDALSLKLAGVPNLYGTAARFRSLFLKGAFSFPKRRSCVLNKPHQALKYTAMVHAAGAAQWNGKMPELVLPDDYSPVPEIRNILCMDGPKLLIAPGAAYGDAKRWEPEKFHAVAAWWIREKRGIAIALGGKAEIPAADEVIQGLPDDKMFSLAGKTSLYDLIYVIKNSTLCIGNDSGLMHVAAAAGLPGVGIFASTDPAATAPLSPDWILLHEKQDCSPCFKRNCPDGTRKCFVPCTAEKAIAALEMILQNVSEPGAGLIPSKTV